MTPLVPSPQSLPVAASAPRAAAVAAPRTAPADTTKRVLLSLFLTGASIVYVVEQALVRLRAEDAAAAAQPGATVAAGSATVLAGDGRSLASLPFRSEVPFPPQAVPPSPTLLPFIPDPPVPRANPVREAAVASGTLPAVAAIQPAAPAGKFRDGIYRGSSVSAVFGLVQVEATVKGGRLVEVEAIDYPTSRRTSRRINDPAMPVLRSEAIANQSADVDIITGATLTCVAYARSLASALAEAGP